MYNFAFIQNLGLWDLLIILAIAILLFGHRLPGIGKAMGRSVSEFKEGYKGSGEEGKKSDTAESSEASKKQD